MRLLAALLTSFVLLGLLVGDPREFARLRGGVQRLSIATGGTGGVWYPYGGAVARVIAQHVAGVSATAEATAGTNDNLKFMRLGSADLAFTMADGLDEAHRGVGPFVETGRVPARAIAVLYDNYTHVVARGGSGLRRVADLRGRTVSTGAPGSGTETIALRLLRAAGLDPDRDVRRQSLGAAQSVDALRDGKIDAMIWSGGVPTGAILDLASSRTGATFLPTDDLVAAMNASSGPLYRAAVIPASAYPGLVADVPVVVIPSVLVADAAMSERLAYEITRALFVYRDELVAIHREARHLDPATAVVGSPVPFHPGAITYYRERGDMARLTRAVAIALSLYALYWVVGVVEPFVYRVSFLLLALVLVFLSPGVAPDEGLAAPAAERAPGPVEWVLAAATVLALAIPLLDPGQFVARAATPMFTDAIGGAVVIGLVLEATRRTAGTVLPATALLFLGYAYFGPLLDLVGLDLLAHRGYPLDRLIATQWMTLEGIFGVPLDVASTYLILFTIFGAVLDRTGAGRFFVDWALAAMGRAGGRSGAGRAVVAAGFLLGMVSGSGVATTVTLASCAWPMLERSGCDRETGAAIFAASGIGAILAPPALGAAAFLIAEFVGIPYRQVIAMAIVPAALYYVSVILMIDGDARRSGIVGSLPAVASIGTLTRQWGQFFIAPLLMIALLAAGMSAFRAVTIAAVVALAAGWLRRESRLDVGGVLDALAQGGRAILPIIATTATAGIIVGVVTLTGLGLNLAGIIVSLAGGHALLTVLYAAVAVWMLGLAVPVTASYIIAAVMIVPALTQAGIPLLAAHMFVFYYAVLSEVTPPTALAPMAAAAITRANPYPAMMRTWKYTLPAFVVPIAFVADERGMGLLLQAALGPTIVAVATALAGVAALATGMSGWLGRPLGAGARAALVAAGLLLILPGAATDLVGGALALGAALPWLTRRWVSS